MTIQTISIGVFVFGVCIAIYCLTHWKLIIKSEDIVKGWKPASIVTIGFIALAFVGITSPKFTKFAIEVGKAKFNVAQLKMDLKKKNEELAAIQTKIAQSRESFFKPLAEAIAEAENNEKNEVLFGDGGIAVRASSLDEGARKILESSSKMRRVANGSWVYMESSNLSKNTHHAIIVNSESGDSEAVSLENDQNAVKFYQTLRNKFMNNSSSDLKAPVVEDANKKD